jgi:hypothetical protein
MRRTLSVLIAGLAVSGTGLALVADPVTVPIGQTGLENDHYVDPDSRVWRESNGCDGLQEKEVNCRGGIAKEPADEQVLALPAAPGELPEVPAPGVPGVPGAPGVPDPGQLPDVPDPGGVPPIPNPGGVPSVPNPGGVPPLPNPGGVPPVPTVPAPGVPSVPNPGVPALPLP